MIRIKSPFNSKAQRSLRARIPYAIAVGRDGEPGRLEPLLNLFTSTRLAYSLKHCEAGMASEFPETLFGKDNPYRPR
ncbi:MAG: hypothetical protein ABIM74_07590 [candidate division WOR-3 bacterium]